jgi:hypothetical protein
MEVRITKLKMVLSMNRKRRAGENRSGAFCSGEIGENE